MGQDLGGGAMKIFLAGKRVYFECLGEFIVEFGDIDVPADTRKLWVAIGPYTQEYKAPIFPTPTQYFSMSLIEGDYVLGLVGSEREV